MPADLRSDWMSAVDVPEPCGSGSMATGLTNRKRLRWLLGGGVLAIVAGTLIWALFFQTYHLMAVQPGVLYRDGNRGMREFRTAIRQVRPRTVVCLVSDEEVADPKLPMFREEFAYLRDSGIRLVRLPIAPGGWPTSDDIETFLSVVNSKANQPVLVHCAQGIRRTGMLVAAYQVRQSGYAPARAIAEIPPHLASGHPHAVQDIQRFIEHGDSASGSIPLHGDADPVE
jgi:protein tyrosine phosphatase (PTP) superfamily phosphohydrolase (DUF442 family)